MKIKARFILIIIVLAVAFYNQVNAQEAPLNPNDDKYNHEIKQISHKDKRTIGDDLFNAGSYYNAIEYYKDFLVDDNSDPYVTFKLAEAYRYSRDYKRAEEWYKKAYEIDNSQNSAALFYQALMMRYNCKHEQAKTLFEKFLDGSGKKDLKRQAAIELEGCDSALVFMRNPIPLLNVKHLGSAVNNPYSDFGPAADGNNALVYTSVKSDTVVIIGDNNRANYVSRVYRSTRHGAHWSKGVEFGNDNINSDVDHTGNGSFSPNGKRFFFTRCHEISPIDLHIKCDIYMAKKENGEWQKPIRLDSKVNDSKSTNTQPSIGKAGGATYLYFTSNRDGGVGGLDIWRVKISSDGEVGGEPENLGKQINTKQDECTPFYDNVENILYFSSNGKVGMGGFDIYKAAADGKSFLEPRNVGFPLNSCVDDRYFTLLPNHRGGFFVSNRPEDFYFKSSDGASIKSPTCCDDIFEYTIDIIPHFALKGYVFNVEDKEKAQPLTDVLVYLENNNEKLLKMDTTSFKQRKYFFDTEKDHQYKLKASANGFYDGYAAASFEGLTESDTLRVDIFLRPIKTETVRLEGIFYDFDKATLRPESDSTLQALTKFMSDQANIRVEIASHTDSKGSDDYNERLSQARAQSVVDYLIAHGIESSRLEAKGYGERNPEVPNTNPDGSDCPVCRQRNRRTEFKILGQVKGINIIYNQGMPSVIDSTASTHEKIQKEAMGEGREELNATGQVTGSTEQSFKDGIKMGGSSKGSGSIFNNKNYEQVQEKPKDVEDEQPEVIIKEVAPKKNNPPQPNFNAPPPSNNNNTNNSTPNNNDNNREIKNNGNGGNSTSTKNDEDEDKQPTPPKLNAKEKKEAEKAAKDEKVRIQKAEKEAKKKADEQAKKEKAEKAKADAEAKKEAKQTASKPVNDSKKSSEKEAKKKAESKAKKSSDENKADDE